MIGLTREIRFSLEATTSVDRPESANTWAGWPTALRLAPYLRLQVTIIGKPDANTGYLCDIKILDDLLRTAALRAAQRIGLAGVTPESFLLALWKLLHDSRPAGATLTELRLLPTPYQSFAICRASLAMIYQTEQFEFSAAHRLHCPELGNAENQAIFGKCNNPHGHGHNYVVDVVVAGSIDPATGLLLPRHHLAEVVKRQVLDRFDHKHLNEDTEEFRSLNPTVENIARVIFALLVDHVTPARLERVRVYETPKTWADYRG